MDRYHICIAKPLRLFSRSTGRSERIEALQKPLLHIWSSHTPPTLMLMHYTHTVKSSQSIPDWDKNTQGSEWLPRWQFCENHLYRADTVTFLRWKQTVNPQSDTNNTHEHVHDTNDTHKHVHDTWLQLFGFI